MLIKDIMTKDITTVNPKMSVHRLAELFIEKNGRKKTLFN